MSTVALRQSSPQQRALSAQTHRQLLNPTGPRSASHPQTIRQDEKNAGMAHYEGAAGRENAPSDAETAQEPPRRQPTATSRKLRVDDFELMKTLGTGVCSSRVIQKGRLSASNRPG